MYDQSMRKPRSFAMESGLENVVAAETMLSDVDGAAGRLIIRGISLDDLGGQSAEAVAALLFEGFFDDLPDSGAFAARLGPPGARWPVNCAMPTPTCWRYRRSKRCGRCWRGS